MGDMDRHTCSITAQPFQHVLQWTLSRQSYDWSPKRVRMLVRQHHDSHVCSKFAVNLVYIVSSYDRTWLGRLPRC